MQAYRTRQEDQLGALGLVLNAAVLWTTRYLDAAVEQLWALPAEAREHDVLNEDVARLSPLKHANLNVLSRYSFRASTPAGGGLRPRPPPASTRTRRDEPQVCSAGGGIAVRGASPLREELVRPQRTAKAKARRLPTHRRCQGQPRRTAEGHQ